MSECILVVDDDREIVRAIAILLEKEGYQVLKAYDGMQALELIAEQKVHLVIMDVMMPKLDGLSAVLKIRERKNIPIIVLSAKSEDTDKVLGLSMGADDYISKPFHAKILLMRCNNLIRNRLLLKSQLTKQVDFDVQLLATTSLDQQLLNRIVKIVDLRMGEPDFDVNALARELNMGRSSFFTKVKNLTGMTPSELIQNQRINRASILLRERPDLLVNEKMMI